MGHNDKFSVGDEVYFITLGHRPQIHAGSCIPIHILKIDAGKIVNIDTCDINTGIHVYAHGYLLKTWCVDIYKSKEDLISDVNERLNDKDCSGKGWPDFYDNDSFDDRSLVGRILNKP